jgi:hypothetical protein
MVNLVTSSSSSIPPEGHPYLKVISGDFAPSRGSEAAWKLAKPIAEQLLLTDYAKRDSNEDQQSALSRISALCLYLVWIAENVPEHLLNNPMDHDEIRRYLATDGMTRRASHRSRVALGSTLRSVGPACNATNRSRQSFNHPTYGRSSLRQSASGRRKFSKPKDSG